MWYLEMVQGCKPSRLHLLPELGCALAFGSLWCLRAGVGNWGPTMMLCGHSLGSWHPAFSGAEQVGPNILSILLLSHACQTVA